MGLPNGNFAVVWTDSGWNEGGTLGNGISLAVFNGQFGFAVSNLIHVNIPDAADESDPDVTVLPNGFIVVTWTYPVSATNHDIYARVFDQNGNAIEGFGQMELSDAVTDEVRSAVSHLSGGKFIASWQDSKSDGNGGRITSTVTEITRAVHGDGANDVFVGDALSDIFLGGAGDDRFVYKPGGNADTMFGFVAGAGSEDKVVLSSFGNIHTLSDVLARATQVGADTVIDFGGGDTLALRGS